MKQLTVFDAGPAILTLILLLASTASGQNSGRLTGQVLDRQGQPYANVAVTITDTENGQTFTTKTGKDGHYRQIGLRGGTYTLHFQSPTNAADDVTDKVTIAEGQETTNDVNFQQLAAAAAAANPGGKAKVDEEKQKFGNMKAHFDAGVTALTDAGQLQTQIRSTPAAQRSPLESKLAADSQTAMSEFQQAEQLVNPKDVNNHAMIWGNLGLAQEYAGKYDDAVASFSKALELKPSAGYYMALATDTAKAAVAAPVPKTPDAGLAEAGADCDKAIALDPTMAGTCWRNLGIVYSNKSRTKEAAQALQKAVQADPKNPDAWFWLGGALTANVETKEEGGKVIYNFPAGTADAYQKYLELAPNGPHAAEAKESLASIQALSQGQERRLKRKKP